MKRLGLLLFACATACGGTQESVEPGALTLTLTSGGPNDGAMVVLVSGGPVLSVDGAAGYQVAANADARGTHVMIVGNIASGALATLHVADVSRASAYVVTVEQVADRSSFALLDPVRDQVSIGPAR
ncbi:MAG: hypothetical protein ACREK8_08765 [Gemmatimonadales bacterium]